MTDEEKLQALADQEIERLTRITRILEGHDTAGPGWSDVDEEVLAPHPAFVDGFWVRARRTPAHPARVGGPIGAFGIVVHSTDMHPNDWNALIVAYTTQPGKFNCATFGIGRTPEDGIVQFVPITRNSNHAGGSGHGVYVAGAITYHPNLYTVGIEVHCAGGVRMLDGVWRWGENRGDGHGWQPHGDPLPAAEVRPDPARCGLGWHLATAYQLNMLSMLIGDLKAVLRPMPDGCIAKSTVEAVPAWGVARNARIVGHVTLDPANRSDPWPPMMAEVVNGNV